MSCSFYFFYVAEAESWPAAAVVLGSYGNTRIRLNLQLTGIPTGVGTQHVPTFPPAYNYRKWMD